MLKIFDNFDYFQQSWQFLTILKIFDNLNNFWQFWQLLTILTIFTIFDNFNIFFTILTIDDNFYNLDNCFCHFDNWNDNHEDLWYLRHWLQFWQLRTWIHDNLTYLTIKSDAGQNSQLLRCLRVIWEFMAMHCLIWNWGQQKREWNEVTYFQQVDVDEVAGWGWGWGDHGLCQGSLKVAG